ncbi:SCO3374 family protein [Streptomyces sp. NPDC006172]|uniref:SCO3374 family protein n=1 Tax=Streptomyces sp. NPDC006172 TaxID=3154470 RepID=UPI0033C8D167
MVGPASSLVPSPRRPLDPGPAVPADRVRGWYENELGWATVPGEPVRLSVGVRFDVLDVPAGAGHAALRRLPPGAPVAVRAERMQFLVAAGSAEELPGILRWLEWEPVALDLRPIGPGGAVEAPRPTGLAERQAPQGNVEASSPSRDPEPASCAPCGRPPEAVQGAAVWLRPPVAGREVEASLPTVSALGGGGVAPDLVRLVNTLATHCHRVRLLRACAQPLAFS